MSREMMSTEEVALYLGVHEKHVYRLIKTAMIPATKVTGKWIFPRRLIDRWIETSAMASLAPEVKERMRRNDDGDAIGHTTPSGTADTERSAK